MEKLLLVLFNLGLWSVYIGAAFMVAILIQFIVYQLTGVSLFNAFIKVALTDQIKK